ncbi:protocadherin gamma-C3-like [Salmo trutta]|uniref:protocadherin gamma-C3-like n=1 Tax=Salmo trutta TaxID=8032 RepID=UPI0011314E63|nr:protocadherin gamma-C3-like [Salmo trutta]
MEGGFIIFNIMRWQLFCRMHWQLRSCFIACLIQTVCGQIRYSIPEELKKGYFVGNIAQDLGLNVGRLRSGRARIVTGDSIQYTELKTDKGVLVVSERIDREQLCGDFTPRSFTFEIILKNPIELTVSLWTFWMSMITHRFKKKQEIKLKISESAAPGARFVLGSAEDPDVGINALQNDILTPNDNFILKQHTRPDGLKWAEMVLQKPLDREQEPRISLTLTAVDGGNPQRSGSVNIEVTILDANDNAPVFNQSVYRATVMENASIGTYITTVNASDSDSGSNGLITYSFSNMNGKVADVFSVVENTGIIYVVGQLDHEKTKKYDVGVEAKDQGGLADSSKVIDEVVDVNDNAPVINVMSFSYPVTEDAPVGTTIAVINVKDIDSELNGQVTCNINHKRQFKIMSSLTNYYTLVTDSAFDREI